jgi:hypothetical protein
MKLNHVAKYALTQNTHSCLLSFASISTLRQQTLRHHENIS